MASTGRLAGNATVAKSALLYLLPNTLGNKLGLCHMLLYILINVKTT